MADQYNNGMQAQLGLSGRGSMAPGEIATQPIQMSMPTVPHPGEVSARVSQQSMAAAFQTMQTVSIGKGVAPSPGIYNPAGDANFNPIASGVTNMFAQQYRNNMAGITAQHFNPYVAQALGGMGGGGGYGGPGFNTGMMAGPASFTSPDMGIFRGFNPPPTPMVSPFPRVPLFQTPFNAAPPPPMFQTPFDHQVAMGRSYTDQLTSTAMAMPGTMGHIGGGVAGFGLGGAMGAALGNRFAGGMGARIGFAAGGALGAAGMEFGGFSDAIGGAVDRFNPLRTMGPRAAQMQTMSQNFVVGGANLDYSGRGFSAGASYAAARGLEDMGYSQKFRRETGGMFNTNDVFKIAKGASDSGMLDMAQDPQQMTAEVRKIAKSLRVFMQIANEPDVQAAMQQMSQMRSMGLNLSESTGLMSQAKMFSRMAGTTVQGVMEAGGLPGAMMYQQQGLSAGLGMQMGIGALGMARSSVAAGTFNTQQLGMLGGVSGIAQREMQSNAAFLKTPMLTSAMSTYDPRTGSFGINNANVGALRSGSMNLADMARMGAGNLHDAVRQGGIGAIGMMGMQQEELQDSLGRQLGPMGTTMARMRQVQNLAKMMRLSGPGGFVTAGQAMGMSADETRQLAQQAANPETFASARKQLDISRRDVADRYREFVDNREMSAGPFAGTSGGRYLNSRFDSLGRGIRGLQEGLGSALAETSESSEYALHRETPSELQAGARQRQRMRKVSISREERAAFARDAEALEGTAAFRFGGRGYGHNAVTGALSDALGGPAAQLEGLREAQGGLASVFGGGYLEAGARLATVGLTGSSPFGSKEEIARNARGVGNAQRNLTRGLNAKASQEATDDISKTLGGDRGRAVQSKLTTRLVSVMKSKVNLLGGTTALSDKDFVKLKNDAVAAGEITQEEADKLSISTLQKSLAHGASARAGDVAAAAISGATPDVAADVSKEDSAADAALKLEKAQNEKLFGGTGGLTGAQKTLIASAGVLIPVPQVKFAAAAILGVNELISRGDVEKQNKAKDLLFNGSDDPDAGLAASLMATADAGGPGAAKAKEQLDKLLEKDVKGVTRRAAERLVATADSAGLKESLASAGKSYADTGDLDAARKKYGSDRGDSDKRKEILRQQRGINKLTTDKAVRGAQERGGGRAVLELVMADESKVEGFSSHGKKILGLAKELRKAETEEQKEAIGLKMDNLLSSGGDAGTRLMRGGAPGMADIDAAQEGLTDTEGAMAESFPEATRTFLSASEKMADTMSNLQQWLEENPPK